MMKKILIPIGILMATSLSIAASQAANKTLALETFSKIDVYAPLDLDISVGKEQSFTIKGKDKDIAKIIVEVKNGHLIIKKKKKSDHIDRVNVTIGMMDLTEFVVNGSSDAVIRDVKSSSFDVQINGSGDVTFGGKSDKLGLIINGSGGIKSENFDSQKVAVEISGSGDISLKGKCQDMKISISGAGDFSGKELTCADVKIQVSGSGDVTAYAHERVEIDASGNSDVTIFGHPKSVNNRSSGSSEFIIYDDN